MSSAQNISLAQGRTLGPQRRRNDSAMSRPVSPGPTTQEDKVYTQGVFADPKPVKAMGMVGPAIFQPQHKTLIERLRNECDHLRSSNRDLRERANTAERKVRLTSESLRSLDDNLQGVITDLRQRNHDKAARIVTLTEELREAQQALLEMDQMFSDTRNKRLSRIQARTTEAVGEARANFNNEQSVNEGF